MDFEIFEIKSGFWCITQNGVRSFLFVGTDRAVLVDSCMQGDIKSVCEKITDKPITLVLTHSDRDHTGGFKLFNDQYMHPAEFSTFKEKNSAVTGAKALWTGDIIDIGNFKLEVFLFPGHTPGSIILLEREKRFVIGGDSIQSGPIYMFGPGRDIRAFAESLKHFMAISSGFDIVYSSHNELEVDPSVIPEIYDLANDIIAGNLPTPSPAPSRFPNTVKIYSKARAQLLLSSEEL